MQNDTIEIYEYLNMIVENLESSLPDITVSINTKDISDSKTLYYMVLNHVDGFKEEYIIKNDITENSDANIDGAKKTVNSIIKKHRKYLLKKYHLKNSVYSMQIDKFTLLRIESLAKQVLSGLYDGIEIENSIYSTSQFNNQMVKLSKTKGNLKHKSEPIVYIGIYEFYYSTLFNLIYCGDTDEDINVEWADEWTDINAELVISNAKL